MPTPASSPLHYDPAAPLLRRLGRSVILVLLPVVSLASYRRARPFVRQARLLYWQRK
jgi:hypothetical protein